MVCRFVVFCFLVVFLVRSIGSRGWGFFRCMGEIISLKD